jgi:hypothetical protein
MRHIQIGLFLATIVLSLMASATPSAAVIIYPWCANYMGRYTLSCGSYIPETVLRDALG